MRTYNSPDIVNIGTGTDISIKELANTIAEVTGYQGTITWDTSKPDGTPRKLLDVTKLRELGFRHSIELKDGIHRTYTWYKEHHANNN
jgi:GDP-L-fucose synthase